MKSQSVFGALILVCGLAAHGAFEVPALTGPVVDQANMLNRREQQELSEFLQRLSSRGHVQLQVLTVPSLEGETIEQASIKVTDAWKLGNDKADNGVLLMVAQQERRMRIEVGQGLEGVIPDVIASRIIREQITPWFRQGAPGKGIATGAVAVAQLADPEFLGNAADAAAADGFESQPKSNVAPFIVFLAMMGLFLRPRGFGRRRLGGVIFPGGGGFGGGFGGGWGGGGGGFSGGGASGGW